MGLTNGYKQTDVGVIPDDWEVNPITEYSLKITDGEHITPQRTESGYYLLSARNILNGKVDTSDVDFVGKEEYLRIRQRCNPEFGDVLISCSGSIGRVATVPENFECVMVRSAALVKPNYSKTTGLYIQYFLQSSIGQKQIFASMNQGAQPNLFLNHIQSLQLACPPNIEEQNAITTALNDTDILIARLENLIAKKRNIKLGAMKRLLEPKEGWLVKKLADFLDFEQPTNYLVTDTEYNDNNQTPVLTAGKTFILGYTNEEHGIFNKLPVIIFDDFTTAIKYVDFPFKAKSSAMKMLLPKNESVNLRLIYEIMLQIKYQIADHKRHWIAEFSKIEIIVPPTSTEQNAIAEVLSDMDSEIVTLENKLEKYKNVKLGMMQNLLTGKIRLV